jgi:hypothetical protein
VGRWRREDLSYLVLRLVNPSDLSIVFYADKEFAAVRVGERDERFPNIRADELRLPRFLDTRAAIESGFEFAKMTFPETNCVSNSFLKK